VLAARGKLAAATLPSAQQRKALRRPRERRGAGAYRGGRPPAYSLSTDEIKLLTYYEKQTKLSNIFSIFSVS